MNVSHGQDAAVTGETSIACVPGCGTATGAAAFISTPVLLSSRLTRDFIISAAWLTTDPFLIRVARYGDSLLCGHAYSDVVPRLDSLEGLFKGRFQNTLADRP